MNRSFFFFVIYPYCLDVSNWLACPCLNFRDKSSADADADVKDGVVIVDVPRPRIPVSGIAKRARPSTAYGSNVIALRRRLTFLSSTDPDAVLDEDPTKGLPEAGAGEVYI